MDGGMDGKGHCMRLFQDRTVDCDQWDRKDFETLVPSNIPAFLGLA